MNVTTLNWTANDDWTPYWGAPVRVYVEENGEERIILLNTRIFCQESDKKYHKLPTPKPEEEQQWKDLAKTLIEKDYITMHAFPDISEASPLTKELFDDTCECLDNEGIIYTDWSSKRKLVQKYGVPWDILEKALILDIDRFDLTCITIKNYCIRSGSELMTKFKYSLPTKQ